LLVDELDQLPEDDDCDQPGMAQVGPSKPFKCDRCGGDITVEVAGLEFNGSGELVISSWWWIHADEG